MIIRRVKNNTSDATAWCGQIIEPGEYYQIEDREATRWSSDTLVFSDVGVEHLVVNDGSKDFTDPTQGWNWILGDTEMKTPDDKQWIQETSRPLGMITTFTSIGDATTAPDSTVLSTAVGDGAYMKVNHVAGNDSTVQYIYMDFNVMENTTYLHEGYITWEGCSFDSACMGAVPWVTDTTAMSNTYFNIPESAPYLLVPAAGDGSYNPVVDGTVGRYNLVESTVSRDTGIRRTAYWNCPYDTTTHTFGDLAAAPSGDGRYNIFTTEVELARFVNKALLLNEGFLMLQSADVEQIGHGMRIRLGAATNTDTTDHDWRAGFIITLNREKTC